MATANVTIRMDKDLKAAMEELCADMGMNLTTAFTIFAKKAVAEQGIPFKVSRPDPFYSESNLRTLKESAEQAEQGKLVYKTLEELQAMENAPSDPFYSESNVKAILEAKAALDAGKGVEHDLIEV